jgi:hypothetical protein
MWISHEVIIPNSMPQELYFFIKKMRSVAMTTVSVAMFQTGRSFMANPWSSTDFLVEPEILQLIPCYLQADVLY